MAILRKQKFNATASGLPETVVEQRHVVVERTPIRDTCLPLPESFLAVRDVGLALPLEYIGKNWILLVLTNISQLESIFVRGSSLHRHWEDSQMQRRGGTSPECPIGYILVRCPNDSCLFVKILSFVNPIPQALLPVLPFVYRKHTVKR
tara:strand:+ start:4643 stop:5089 length:447 start_codon:yes stop_codon:yes gene_type:complete